MEECCSGKTWALKWLILGIILIVVRIYTSWDIWVVLGVLLVIKALILIIMPMCCKTKKKR